MGGPNLGGFRALLALRDYRIFWVGFTFSMLGDSLGRVALVWYVYEETDSARALGWLMLCYTGPILFGGFVAGSLLDRFDRRRVMLIDNAVRCSFMVMIPLLFALDRLALWHIYAAAIGYGALMMISLAGGPSLIPSLVPAERLMAANAMEMLSFTIGGVIGPPIAGLLLARIAVPYVVLIDALTYALFALALAFVRAGNQSDEFADEPPAERRGLGDAIRLLLGNPVLRSTTVMFMAFNIGFGMMAVWLPVLVDRDLGGGAGLYGLLLGLIAIGEVVGALAAGGVVLPLTVGSAICLAQALSGASLLLFQAPNAWIAGAGSLVFGVCSAPLTVWAQTLRMAIIPARLRGRTFALLRTIMQGGNPVGGALAGVLLPIAGVAAMIAISTGVVAIPGLLGLRQRELRGAHASDTSRATAPAD